MNTEQITEHTKHLISQAQEAVSDLESNRRGGDGHRARDRVDALDAWLDEGPVHGQELDDAYAIHGKLQERLDLRDLASRYGVTVARVDSLVAQLGLRNRAKAHEQGDILSPDLIELVDRELRSRGYRRT